ncbi:5'/3'-nucleotidase SurE [Pseudomonas viridiflava]|uniref:5'/3'-nucleotidase SurE n=1 Tax=Pseudomonas viridiflava TaxID=33069 RepID=UPI00083FB1DE|nr:5'/3'-nucleotidase SurE [Pseudomonas viridiflava]ODJ94886.1 5'/3'-nucleotidase SurE [Pseudomonas viridiflava]
MSFQKLPRILITNDDGIDAPGLLALEEVAGELADEVWIVAPDHDQSGISHALSIHHPLRVTKRGERRFSVSGTPADCVAMALQQLMSQPPTLILSGINKGANLGVETVFSGTVGAAMAGLLLGVPSIALSQALTRRDSMRWETARQLAPDVIRKVWGLGWEQGACLNINFPDVPAAEAGPMQFTNQGAGRIDSLEVTSRTDMRERDYFWLSIHRHDLADAPGSETHVVMNGGVSVTPLRFERTDTTMLDQLKARFQN